VSLEGAAQRNGVRSALQALAAPDPFGNALNQVGAMVQASASLSQDVTRLVADNGCDSKALTRLQENMTRFAIGEDPLHVAGFAPDTTKIPHAQDLDVRTLADDLIRANAAGWFINHYAGLQRAEVDPNVDPQGRPRHIRASYTQKGITATGSVDIAFVDGVPSCLYFGDEPTNCKPPNPSVVKRYEDGAYRRQSAR
jgi:hypothetical protein